MRTKRGFTLAEVLITLGLIGVVAAVTLPSLNINHKYQQLGVKLTKFNSTMQEAATSYLAMNGDLDNNFFSPNTTPFMYKSTLGPSRYLLNDNTIVHADNGAVPEGFAVPERFGKPLIRLVFEPKIDGLTTEAGTMPITYTFHISNKGYVFPTDECTKLIYENDWKVNKKIAENDVCKREESN